MHLFKVSWTTRLYKLDLEMGTVFSHDEKPEYGERSFRYDVTQCYACLDFLKANRGENMRPFNQHTLNERIRGIPRRFHKSPEFENIVHEINLLKLHPPESIV